LSKKHKKDITASALEATGAPASAVQRMQSQMAGMSYDEQVQFLKPSLPVQPPAQVVQLKDEQEGGGPAPPAGGYEEAIKTSAMAFLKTPLGLSLIDEAKEFAATPGGMTLTGLAGLTALGVWVAEDLDVPQGVFSVIPAIELSDTARLNIRPIWKGPIRRPTELGGMITFELDL